MSEPRPMAERDGLFDLYDAGGSLVGKANAGVRVMLADGFYVRERTCRIVWNDADRTWECSACGGAVGLRDVVYCESCGAKVVDE